MTKEMTQLQKQTQYLIGFLVVLLMLVGIVVIPNFDKFADRLHYAHLKHTDEKIQDVIPPMQQEIIQHAAEKLSEIKLERQEIAEMVNEAQNNLVVKQQEVKTLKVKQVHHRHRHKPKHRLKVQKIQHSPAPVVFQENTMPYMDYIQLAVGHCGESHFASPPWYQTHHTSEKESTE